MARIRRKKSLVLICIIVGSIATIFVENQRWLSNIVVPSYKDNKKIDFYVDYQQPMHQKIFHDDNNNNNTSTTTIHHHHHHGQDDYVNEQEFTTKIQRLLPDMTTLNGGMVFFLHVPKTGGTTIRENFGDSTTKFGHAVHYIVGNWKSKMTCALNDIEIYLNNNSTASKYIIQKEERKETKTSIWKKLFSWQKQEPEQQPQQPRRKVLFLEVHGMDSYNAIELQPYIKKWRSIANEHNVPFFAFTILREAISSQISFFNFYRITYKDCRFDTVPSTFTPQRIETYQLLQKSYHNPQCLFLSRGERVFGEKAMTCYGTHSNKCTVRIPHPIKQRQQQQQGKTMRSKRIKPINRRRRQLRDRYLLHHHEYQWDDTDFDNTFMNVTKIIPSLGIRRRTHPGRAVTERRRLIRMSSFWNKQKTNPAGSVGKIIRTTTAGTTKSLTLKERQREQLIQLRQNLTQDECYHLYTVLQDSMDWIGVLDRLNEETLPMLTQMIYGNANLANEIHQRNTVQQRQEKQKEEHLPILHMKDLQNTTIQQLWKMSRYDDELFQRASKDYTTDLWQNFP